MLEIAKIQWQEGKKNSGQAELMQLETVHIEYQGW